MEKQSKKMLPGLCLLSFSTFIVCVPAAFTQIISFNLMLDLNAFPDDSYAWTFPMFVAGECAAMGLCAGTMDRFGRRKPYLAGSLMFVASSIVCAMATDMMVFNISRLVQGFGTGLIIVTCIAQIYFDIDDRKDRYMANGIMSLGFGGGMLVGLFAGKAVLETIGWPVAFWAMAVLQAIVTFPALQVLKNGKNSEMKADLPGAIILTIWAAVFVIFLQEFYLNWSIRDTIAQAAIAFIVMLFLIFMVAEVRNPDSMFHRKVRNKRLVSVSMVFIVLLGVLDMGAVGFMVKTAFFTFQMSVSQAAPFFIVMVLGAAVTAICISKTIDRTGHLPWLLLSVILSPIALVSMQYLSADDPFYIFAGHLFLLGLAIGCLVSMLNATIQNRTNEDNNGAMMSFAIMMRTVALWLGYNLYQHVTDAFMASKISSIVDHWNSILPFELPSNTSLANLLITPLGDAIRLLPGLTDEIAEVFAEGVGYAFTLGAIAFVVIGLPVALLLLRREKDI